MAGRGPIVVGTDGSERAERAVDRAGELAKLLGVTIHVMSGHSDERGARSEAERYLNQAHERLVRTGVDSETHLWSGEPVEGLLAIAEEQDAQMIVVGNRGMTGARRVLGSVPNRVSHRARCDVLIVATA
jgi:nucleotide-binding universal stress UspA family protein